MPIYDERSNALNLSREDLPFAELAEQYRAHHADKPFIIASVDGGARRKVRKLEPFLERKGLIFAHFNLGPLDVPKNENDLRHVIRPLDENLSDLEDSLYTSPLSSPEEAYAIEVFDDWIESGSSIVYPTLRGVEIAESYGIKSVGVGTMLDRQGVAHHAYTRFTPYRGMPQFLQERFPELDTLRQRLEQRLSKWSPVEVNSHTRFARPSYWMERFAEVSSDG